MKRRLQQSERVHKQTDQQIHDLQHRLEEVEQDLSSKKKECNDLRSREDNLLRQMETLETSVVSLKKLLTSSKTNGTHLRQQLEEQTLAYNQATEALQQKEEELAAFEATRLQFEKEIQQSNEEKAQLEENMKKLQDDLSSTDHAMTELRNENASLKESIELLRGNIEHMGGSMTSLMDFDSVGDLGSKRGSIISLSGRRRRSKQRNLSFMVSTQEGDTPVTDGKLLDNLVVTLAPGTPRTPNTPATPKRPKGVPFNPSTPGARAYEDVEQIVNDNNFLRLVPIVREWVDKSIQVNLLRKSCCTPGEKNLDEINGFVWQPKRLHCQLQQPGIKPNLAQHQKQLQQQPPRVLERKLVHQPATCWSKASKQSLLRLYRAEPTPELVLSS
ncbi:hypothetical protein DFS34DRAFT_448050 [Phlyctochytrium arcticum]|nr:hypothetical protein DFS34DRAFT_448050 [Phlyctochytrium arcticum]